MKKAIVAVLTFALAFLAQPALAGCFVEVHPTSIRGATPNSFWLNSDDIKKVKAVYVKKGYIGWGTRIWFVKVASEPWASMLLDNDMSHLIDDLNACQ